MAAPAPLEHQTGVGAQDTHAIDPEKSSHDSTHGLKDLKGAGDAFDVAELDRPHTNTELLRVPLEERIYWANQQRMSYGMHSDEPKKPWTGYMNWFPCDFGPDVPENPLRIEHHQRLQHVEKDEQLDRLTEFQKDKAKARVAMRTASWASVFYLITTDVIGPFNAPFAISQVGLAGGIMLYITFGIAALYSSFLIMNLYLRLDSDRHPLRSLGDVFAAFVGKWGSDIPAVHLISTMQVLQIVFVVASNTVVNANSMTQLTSGADGNDTPLCYIVSMVIWTVIGIVNSIPFLHMRWLAVICSGNIFINFLIIFLSMGFIAHSDPNYASAAATFGYTAPYDPIMVTATTDLDLQNQLNGASAMIFGWSGLMVFVEFLNEMRRPYEFWKSFGLAEIIIMIVYVGYGVYVYALQGQYTLPASFQGVSPYVWQSVGNGLALWTYVMASVLYLNVAIKIAYWWVFEDMLGFGPINSKVGWIVWTCMQLAAWWIAMVIGAAIPQVQTIQGLTAVVFLLQFSYTFPPLMQFLLDVQVDASKLDGVFVPGEPPKRYDSWLSIARWRRGLFGGGIRRVGFKTLNLCYVGAALATCGLGFWANIETIVQLFATSQATSFGCLAPV